MSLCVCVCEREKERAILTVSEMQKCPSELSSMRKCFTSPSGATIDRAKLPRELELSLTKKAPSDC